MSAVGNPFDQFDAPKQGAGSANPFDQFDQPAGQQAPNSNAPDAVAPYTVGQMISRDINAPQTGSGLVENFVHGANEAIANTAGMPVDAATYALKKLGLYTTDKAPVLGSDWIMKNYFGNFYDPKKVVAATAPERVARVAGAGATSVVFPEASERTIGDLLKQGLTGSLIGTGSGAAQETVPDKYKNVVGVLGGLATGLTLHGANLLKNVAVTQAKKAATPFAAAISNNAAQSGAANVLAKNMSDYPTVSAALANGTNELVPGSRPTTFEQTGDMGLGSLQHTAETEDREPFRIRAAAQNSARVAALNGIQPTGSPADLSSALSSQFRDMDAQTAAHVDQLFASARDKAAALGGSNTPESYGETIRGSLQEAENTARTRESALWKAIDPAGDLTGNVSATSQAAKDIQNSTGRLEKPIQGEEAAILSGASSLPNIAPVSDLIDLRSRVSTEMRNELVANGRSRAYGRLSQLRAAIQGNLADTIGDNIANEQQQVGTGQISLSDTIAARLKDWQDEFYAQREQQAGAASLGSSAAPGAVQTDGAGGATFSAEGGFGNGPSNPGVSADAPTFDAAASERLAAASTATKERARTFGINPIGPALAKAGAQDLYKLPDSRVPEKFFHPGPSGYQDMQSLYKAVGQERAQPIIQDYAASSLRRAALRDDGTLDPQKYARWKAAHADAIRALPDSARGQFADTARATQALEDAAELRNQTIKASQEGAVARIMNAQSPEEVIGRVGSIFGARDSVSQMASLARAASRNPDAVEGLRKSVADYISGKFISNTEAATSGTKMLRSDAFQSFVKGNRAALAQVFKPAEMDTLSAIADDLSRSNRSVVAVKMPGRSNTAEDTFALNKKVGASKPSVLRYLLDSTAAATGFGAAGLPGAVIAGLGAHTLQWMRQAGISNINELVSRALLDPLTARALLEKVSIAQRSNRLSAALRRYLSASTTALAGSR